MAEITLESLYKLVENMADYLMTKVATKEELNRLSERVDRLSERVDQLSERVDQLSKRVDELQERLDLLTIRVTMLEKEFERFRIEVNKRFDRVMEGMDAQAGQLDILRTESVSQSHALDDYDERVGNLEEQVFGKRIRDKKEKTPGGES